MSVQSSIEGAVDLKQLFSQAPVAIGFLAGPQLILQDANDPMLALWGKDVSIIGLPIIEAIPEIKDQPFPQILKDVYDTGVEYRGYETPAKLVRNGVLETCYFNFIYSPVRNSLGDISGISLIANEVTEQVVAKKELQASENRFRSLVLKAEVATGVYVGKEMRIDIANDAMIKLWGKNESVIGQTLKEALPELEGQPFHDLLQQVYTTGVTYKAAEDRVDLVVGGRLQSFYFNFTYKALHDTEGEVYGILNMAVDVTDQVLAKRRIEENEVALRLSERRLKELADSMPQIVWTAGSDGHLEYYNKQWYDFTGFDENTFGDQSWAPILHPEDVMRVKETWYNCVKTGNPYQIEYRFKDPNKPGEYRWFLGRAVPIRNEDGKIVKWIGTDTDIHQFKQLEKQKDNFLGIASHELKTPVTSIKAYTQVLESMLQKEGDEKKARLVSRMNFQLNKLTSLIGDLLDVTKVQTGRMQFNDDQFDFNTLVLEIIEELQPTTSTHVIVPQLETAGSVFADRDRIGQVITNLITNAIKYSPAADKVVVTSRLENGSVKLCVRDFGIGIPADQKDRVFEQFYRVGGSREYTFPGLGLGLYISAEIVKREGGEIWVDSVEGQGSTFCFSLPQRNY